MTGTTPNRTSAAAPANRRLNVTDFMNIGIFFVINMVAGVAISFVGITPVTYVAVSPLQAIILGIPMMLFYAKVRKPGMLLIFGILTGAANLLMGLGIWSLLLSIVMAVIAELVLRAGQYASALHSVLAYAFMTISSTGIYIPLFFATRRYLEESDMESKYGSSFSSGLRDIGQMSWLYGVIVVATFVCGIIGGMLGRRICAKHFHRAGIV